MSKPSPAVEKDYADFLPEDYLFEYYAEIGDENRFLMDFHAWVSKAISENIEVAKNRSRILADIGGGPTIYQLISAAGWVDEIHFYEHCEANRDTVQHWLGNGGDSFWDSYFHEALAWETHYRNGQAADSSVPLEAVEARKAGLRAKLSRCAPCDLLSGAVIAPELAPENGYPVVASSFCVEAISDQPDIFMHALNGVISLCADQGYLVLTMVRNCSHYRSGSRHFPAYPVNEHTMRDLLEAKGFEIIGIAAVDAEPLDRGYEGLFGILAKRNHIRGRVPNLAVVI